MKYTLNEHEAKQKITGQELLESVAIVGKVKPETVQKLTESAKGKSKRKLVVQMEAIHVGRTANYTFYTEQGLKDGIESWTHPYNKPVLTHHDAHRGEPIGRILEAKFAESTMSGHKGLIFTCEITDPTAIEKVLDGRYTTVSIGATTDKVTCNICGTDRTQEWCEHWKGEEYDGQTCHFIVGTTHGREVSYVNVPADENAGNFSVSIEDTEEGENNESATLQVFQIAEGLMQNINLPDVNLYENADSDIQNLVNSLMTDNTTTEGSAPKMKFSLNESGQIINTESKQVIDVEEMTKNLSKAQSDLSEAQATLSNLVIEKTKVDSALTEKTEEVDRLTQENADLLEAAHKSLAEKAVDMKLSLRKPDVVGVERDAAVAEHVKRSAESLNDLVKDLQAEMATTTAVAGSVPNPAGTGKDNNPNTNESKDGNKNTNTEEMTADDAVNTFMGMFSSKKRRR